jgi:hypothetical protein
MARLRTVLNQGISVSGQQPRLAVEKPQIVIDVTWAVATPRHREDSTMD